MISLAVICLVSGHFALASSTETSLMKALKFKCTMQPIN